MIPDSAPYIDFRSDTVTRPSAGMRDAMNAAPLGDDVYGEDPTVNALEEKVADLMGKEAALFVSSGTQSNLIALMTHCGRGEEYIAGRGNHISKYEAGGAAVLGGISPRHLQAGADGQIDVAAFEEAINPEDSHFARTKLICLENTYNGSVQDQNLIADIARLARENNLRLHLDGARLMNAVVASNATAASLVDDFDTVSLCLSKGLGAPVGSVLSGPADFIAEARRNRKMLGGGTRQAGILAAAGIYALDHNVDRLRQDHENALYLAENIDQLSELKIQKSETNMVFIKVDDPQKWKSFEVKMREKGIALPQSGQTVRLVAHLDVSKSDCDALLDNLKSHFR